MKVTTSTTFVLVHRTYQTTKHFHFFRSTMHGDAFQKLKQCTTVVSWPSEGWRSCEDVDPSGPLLKKRKASPCVDEDLPLSDPHSTPSSTQARILRLNVDSSVVEMLDLGRMVTVKHREIEDYNKVVEYHKSKLAAMQHELDFWTRSARLVDDPCYWWKLSPEEQLSRETHWIMVQSIPCCPPNSSKQQIWDSCAEKMRQDPRYFVGLSLAPLNAAPAVLGERDFVIQIIHHCPRFMSRPETPLSFLGDRNLFEATVRSLGNKQRNVKADFLARFSATLRNDAEVMLRTHRTLPLICRTERDSYSLVGEQLCDDKEFCLLAAAELATHVRPSLWETCPTASSPPPSPRYGDPLPFPRSQRKVCPISYRCRVEVKEGSLYLLYSS